jgi:hypothetical protein
LFYLLLIPHTIEQLLFLWFFIFGSTENPSLFVAYITVLAVIFNSWSSLDLFLDCTTTMSVMVAWRINWLTSCCFTGITRSGTNTHASLKKPPCLYRVLNSRWRVHSPFTTSVNTLARDTFSTKNKFPLQRCTDQHRHTKRNHVRFFF